MLSCYNYAACVNAFRVVDCRKSLATWLNHGYKMSSYCPKSNHAHLLSGFKLLLGTYVLEPCMADILVARS